MSVDVVLLALRIISAVVLLGFLGAVLVVLWRDYQLAARAIPQQRRGYLIVIRVDAGAQSDTPSDAVAQDGDDTLALDGLADQVRAADLVGARFPLLPLTTLGRAPTNTVVLNDTFCSQEHALIAQRGGQWWIEDRSSRNGTRLNGEFVTEPVVISSGDVIGIGRIALKLELE